MYLSGIKFNDKQLDRLSEISGNLGLLFLGTLVVPILTDQQEFDTIRLVLGMAYSLSYFLFSLILLKGIKK